MSQYSNSAQRYTRQRSFGEKSYLVHHYYKRSGRYRLIGKYTLRLALSLAGLAVGVALFNHYVLDVDLVLDLVFDRFSFWGIVTVFFLSESVLGLLPPDLFIFWAGSLSAPYWTAFLLGFLSYAGGLVSYFIGVRLNHFPWVKKKVLSKYKGQVEAFNKFGSLLIALSALTPLPFAPLSIIAGMFGFSFKKYVWVALVRILRFLLYALAFFELMV